MEAAAVKAAVSGTLNLVCNKLAPLVIKEYNSIVGVKKDLLDLQLLAQGINNRLEAAGETALGDDQSLEKLKQAANDVDDVVDEFKQKAEKYEADGDGGFVSRFHKKPKSFVFQCKAARKIKKIKKTFDDIVKQSAVLNLVPGHGHVSNINMTAVNNQSLPFVDVPSVIGRDQEMHQTISKLLETDDQQIINIVSIVGLGGSGKTTLAQLVFNDVETIKNYFNVRLWVHVSQDFHVGKILKKLFDAIPDEKSEGLSLKNMAEKISDKLTNNRFLLVLDDVWIEDRIKWEEFMVLVKNSSSGMKGSKILLTTRSKKVAKTVESTKLIVLPSLSKDCSWQIFQQSFGYAVNDLDHEFQEVGKEIVKKCGGVPLAIKVLAGVLREKEQIEQWNAIQKSNLLNVESEERQVSACLRLSYFNMPSHLKQCFTICSIFPKGHLIDKDQLIDQWIALDMIPEDRVNYLEYITGNDYFNHLVQMCFIQDMEEEENGKVKCKLHDLVHDLARSILGNEISLVVPKKATNVTKICRYFSISEHTRHLPPKKTFKKARAMYIGEDDDFIFGKASKKAKHLCSITVEGVHTSALTTILQTKNLKYLNISRLEYETLPEVISDIWSLQALHITFSDLVKLPESIGKLQKLRVVNLSNCWWLTGLPDSIGNCVMISSIDLSDCFQFATLPSSIERNKRLRVLRLRKTKIERLPSSITALESLECLDLQRCLELVELPEGIGNLKKLVVLNLKYCEKLRAIPKGIAQLIRLETLELFVMGEDENCAKLSELENVNKIRRDLTISGIPHGIDPDITNKEWLKQKTNLQSLTLICASDVGVNSENQLQGLEPPAGITNLKIVQYSGQESMQWMLKQRGAEVAGFPRFQLLDELELSEFQKLEHLEGLTELPCLKKLVLNNMTALKSISGGPFPSLSMLSMHGMPSLGVVWMATEVSLADVEGGQVQIVEGGQVQIGNCLSVLSISECPKLVVMPYFPSSVKSLRLFKSNVHLLGQPRLGQGSSLLRFTFSCLKELELLDMAPPAGVVYGSGCRWELLQHLTALESLKILCCDGLTKLPKSMRSLASLRTLQIWNCFALCMLPEWLGELCCLEKMDFYECGNLSPTPSMQPPRALKELWIDDSGWVGDLCSPSLQTLRIQNCHSISSLPQSFRQLTSLMNLEIIKCREFSQLPECLGELHSLQILRIKELPKLSSLPESLGYLTSLQELEIEYCEALGQLPDCVWELCSLRIFKILGFRSLTCLPQSLGRLTSLQELEIGGCEALGQLPESLGELRSLRKFEIQYSEVLTSFPESMCCLTSLLQLKISGCQGIKSLPKWIKGLTSLQTLGINSCPNLQRRCERRKGKDWHLISHIPHLKIW